MDEKMPAALCVACGYAFDAAANISGSRRPKPGDLSICLSCGALLVFDTDLRPSRRATSDDVRGMPQEVALQIAAARSFIRRRGPLASGVTRDG